VKSTSICTSFPPRWTRSPEASWPYIAPEGGGIGNLHKNMFNRHAARPGRPGEEVIRERSQKRPDHGAVNHDMTRRAGQSNDSCEKTIFRGAGGGARHESGRHRHASRPAASRPSSMPGCLRLIDAEGCLITVRENAQKNRYRSLLHKQPHEKFGGAGATRAQGMITVKDFKRPQNFPNGLQRTAWDACASVRGGRARRRIYPWIGVADCAKAGGRRRSWSTPRTALRAAVIGDGARIKAKYHDLQVIGGNIVTAEAALDLGQARAGQPSGAGIGPDFDLHDQGS